LKIGGAAIVRYATAFGFSQPTALDLPGEKHGLLPKPQAARGRQGRASPPGEVVNMSIGQGTVLVTPMQVARFMAAVANGGVLWRPRLVQRGGRPDRGGVWGGQGRVNGPGG